MAGQLTDLLAEHALPPTFVELVETLHRPVAQHIQSLRAERSAAAAPLIVGICGAQGSGKTTMTEVLRILLGEAGYRVATLSLDDLYLPSAARVELAKRVHPLLRTRGVPGTHDLKRGTDLLTILGKGGSHALPRFDKATDDPLPRHGWPIVQGPVDIVVLEGWCVGARPEADAALLAPVNALERDEDRRGLWRRFVNAQLAGLYRTFFDRLDLLLLLEAPSFEVVAGWRHEQEDKLRASLARTGRSGGQSPVKLDRFLMHYERITRHILAEMPDRADILIALDQMRQPRSVRP